MSRPTTSYSVIGPIGMPNALAARSIVLDARPFGQQQRGLVHVRQQQAIDQEARAVVHDDRRLAEPAGVGDGRGDRFVARLRAANHFHQRHLPHGIEEVDAAEPLGLLQPFGQLA